MTETQSSASRLRDLLNKFEGVRPPSPPKKERIVSGLDPKRGPLSSEAVSAREASQNILSSQSAQAEQAAKPKRYVPRIAATDSDEVRDLKRAILAKEQEITAVCTQLKAMADRVDRALEVFLASEIENEEQAVQKTPDQRVKAFTVDATKAVDGVVEKPTKTVGSSPTSLEAILAAARSGKIRSTGGGEKPKYSKLLRDMK